MSNILIISVVLLVAIVVIAVLIIKTGGGKNKQARRPAIIQCPRCAAYVPPTGVRKCVDKKCPLRRV